MSVNKPTHRKAIERGKPMATHIYFDNDWYEGLPVVRRDWGTFRSFNEADIHLDGKTDGRRFTRVTTIPTDPTFFVSPTLPMDKVTEVTVRDTFYQHGVMADGLYRDRDGVEAQVKTEGDHQSVSVSGRTVGGGPLIFRDGVC